METAQKAGHKKGSNVETMSNEASGERVVSFESLCSRPRAVMLEIQTMPPLSGVSVHSSVPTLVWNRQL